MSERSAASFIRAAAAGLYHLHQHHIIHNDIKPENLLLTDTDPPTLKLAGEFCDDGHNNAPSLLPHRRVVAPSRRCTGSYRRAACCASRLAPPPRAEFSCTHSRALLDQN